MSEIFKDLNEKVQKSILGLIVESWRFSRAYLRLLEKADAIQQPKFLSQYRFFQKQIEDHLQAIGLKEVNLEGQQFDAGLPAIILNHDEFKAEDLLIIDQMIEPVIMGQDGVIKPGTAMVRKAEK